MSVKLALTDMDIFWEDKEKNREQCAVMAEEAAGDHADGILFPEMTLTGFSMNVDKIADRTGETRSFFAETAKNCGLAAGFGYVTEREGMGRNRFCFVDRTGAVLADYEKIHPFTYGGEARAYEGGQRVCYFDWEGFRCGLFICYDLRFPEAFQRLPLDTDAVFLIANWPKSRLSHWHALLRARAIEMQCFVVGVNRTGTGGGLTYAPSSAAYSPDGRRLREERGERNRYVTLVREERLDYVRRFPVRQDRRPDVYRED